MQATHVLLIAGVLSASNGVTRWQDPPPPPPPVQTSNPQLPVTQEPPTTQVPPAQAPATTQEPVKQEPAAVAAAPVAPAPLSPEQVRERRKAILLFEGVLMQAVKVAAQDTVSEIRRIEPAIVMFSSAPVRAHGTYLEGYGVFVQVEIPSVIPSVASLVETLTRERRRVNSPTAQPTTISGGTTGAATVEPMMDPDAHYVQSVKDQLVNAMIRHSNSMELRPEEWLTVEARDGSETPSQVTQPSTMNLRISGSDLADFFAGRITIEEARKRVQVRGF
jgi:hypothetical protein